MVISRIKPTQTMVMTCRRSMTVPMDTMEDPA